MAKLFDPERWRVALEAALDQFTTTTAALLPLLVGAAILLAGGWVVGRALGGLARVSLNALGLDRVAARLRVQAALERGGIRTRLSALVGRGVFWFCQLVALLSAAEVLGLGAAGATLSRVAGYLPNLLGAGLVFFVGLTASRVLEGAVTSAAAAAGFTAAGRVGNVAKIAGLVLTLVVTLDQLGIEVGILVGPLTALFAAFAFSAGLAFALGARAAVGHIVAGHFLKRSLPRGVPIRFEGREGVVDRIGAVSTSFRDGEDTFGVPNAQLLDVVVEHGAPADDAAPTTAEAGR